MKRAWKGVTAALALGICATSQAVAQAAKDDIRIGQTLPYSGPLSAFGVIGRVEQAMFDKVNAEGGINGRKIRFISLDDAYSPPKTVEHTRKLVESDEVALLFGSLGTATNGAVLKEADQVELCSRTTPTVTSSSPPRSKSRRSWSALIVAVRPSNGPCASTSPVCGSTASTTYPSHCVSFSAAATRVASSETG